MINKMIQLYYNLRIRQQKNRYERKLKKEKTEKVIEQNSTSLQIKKKFLVKLNSTITGRLKIVELR